MCIYLGNGKGTRRYDDTCLIHSLVMTDTVIEVAGDGSAERDLCGGTDISEEIYRRYDIDEEIRYLYFWINALILALYLLTLSSPF